MSESGLKRPYGHVGCNVRFARKRTRERFTSSGPSLCANSLRTPPSRLRVSAHNPGGRVHDAPRPLRLTSPGWSGRRGANLSECTISWANLRAVAVSAERASAGCPRSGCVRLGGNAMPVRRRCKRRCRPIARLFNIRTKFARAFGQPAGECGWSRRAPTF